MREKTYHLYLNEEERSRVIQSLIELKNNLAAQGRYTDAVDDVLTFSLTQTMYLKNARWSSASARTSSLKVLNSYSFDFCCRIVCNVVK